MWRWGCAGVLWADLARDLPDALLAGDFDPNATTLTLLTTGLQDAKEGAEAKAEELEQKRPMEERDIVNAYQAAALDDDAGAVSPSAEYVPIPTPGKAALARGARGEKGIVNEKRSTERAFFFW